MSPISDYTLDAINLLKSLISIPSISREEQQAADFLQAYMEEKGLMPHRLGNNIWCINPDYQASKPTILLNSHIDTVKPVSGWSHQPFKPAVEDDKIYGLGSNDAGASFSFPPVLQNRMRLPQKTISLNNVTIFRVYRFVWGGAANRHFSLSFLFARCLIA